MMTDRERAMAAHPAGKGRMMNPTLGDAVHYVVNGECYVALVMSVAPTGQLDLILKTADGVKSRSYVPKAQVQRCGEGGNPGTWHLAGQPLGVPMASGVPA